MCERGRGGDGPEGLLEGGNMGTEADYYAWVKVTPNTKVTEYSVPVVSVWVLEHHHTTTITLCRHVDRSKIYKRYPILQSITR